MTTASVRSDAGQDGGQDHWPGGAWHLMPHPLDREEAGVLDLVSHRLGRCAGQHRVGGPVDHQRRSCDLWKPGTPVDRAREEGA